MHQYQSKNGTMLMKATSPHVTVISKTLYFFMCGGVRLCRSDLAGCSFLTANSTYFFILNSSHFSMKLDSNNNLYKVVIGLMKENMHVHNLNWKVWIFIWAPFMNFPLTTLLLLPSLELYMQPTCGHIAQKQCICWIAWNWKTSDISRWPVRKK